MLLPAAADKTLPTDESGRVPNDIIGRERELEAVAHFLTHLERRPGMLVLAGELGIGKSTVWEEALERAGAFPLRVLTARPAEAEIGLAFAALADLLDPVVDDVLPALPDPQRRALAIALLREEPGPRPLDQRAVSAAATTALRTLARGGPVVLAIDDAQWLDRPSTHVLQFALRRLDDAPVGLLACQRVERGERPPLFAGAVAEDRVTRVDLGPLSLAALHDLLKERLGRSFTRRTLVDMSTAADGNPFFALEIARSLPVDPASRPGELRIPGRLLELVEGRVRALPERARLALLVAAALRSPTVDQVRAVTGHPPADCRQELEQAESNGIVAIEGRRLRFTHPLFAAAVCASAPPAERRRIHLRLASLMTEIEDRARHLALGAEGVDADLAAFLDEAAEHARSRGAPESAAELVEWARALTPAGHAADVRRRTVRAAEYRFHAGELRPARELLGAVLAEEPGGRLRADALRLLGEIRYHEDSFPEAIRLFEEALIHVDDDPRTESAVQLRLALCFRAVGDFRRAEPHTRRAVALTELLGDGPLHAEALAVMARLDLLLGRGLDQEQLSRALELEDPNRQVAMQLRPSKIAGDLLVYVGELDRSVRVLEQLHARAVERGEDSDLPFVLSHLTWSECWRGRLAEAAAHAEESLEVATRLGSPSVQSMALVLAAVVAAHRGDAARTRQWAEQGLALAESSGWHTPLVWGRWALGALAVSLGDARAVGAALGPLTETVEEEGLAEPVRAMFLADEIEALVALGDLDRATRLTDLLEAAGRRLRRGWAILQAGRCRALVLAARGDVDGAARVAHDALTAGQDVELRLEVARTLLVAGQLERRRRRKAEARALLAQALAIFQAAGAQLWATRVNAELERAASRRAGHQLTSSEQRVAVLAAAGLTNREVAAKLFVSPKTVEANLARAYRKLGIHSRAELGARLGAGRSGAET